MSGHSKWSTIKRQKEAFDLKRGLTFTKLSNAITIAVKRGGGIADPNSNFRLRLAIEAARAANMPKDNIQRAIQKAEGRGAGEVEEVVYEGFAPEGIGVIIEAVTDNSLRTTGEIKSIFNKEGGSFGQPGSVAYLFSQKGRIVVSKNGKTIDEFFEIAVDSGAEDIQDAGNKVIMTTSYGNLFSVREKLAQKNVIVDEAEIIREPLVVLKIADPQKRERVTAFLSKIEELDDVQKVYSNLATDRH